MGDNLILIHNAGGEITDTNYWKLPLARAGKLYLSINASTLRLLVPEKMVSILPEFAGAKEIALTLGPDGGVEILLDDHSDTPYAIQLSAGQLDRRWPPKDDGSWAGFVVYTEREAVFHGTCYLRRAKQLPWLKPVPSKHG